MVNTAELLTRDPLTVLNQFILLLTAGNQDEPRTRELAAFPSSFVEDGRFILLSHKPGIRRSGLALLWYQLCLDALKMYTSPSPSLGLLPPGLLKPAPPLARMLSGLSAGEKTDLSHRGPNSSGLVTCTICGPPPSQARYVHLLRVPVPCHEPPLPLEWHWNCSWQGLCPHYTVTSTRPGCGYSSVPSAHWHSQQHC